MFIFLKRKEKNRDKYEKDFDKIEKYYQEQTRRIPEYIKACKGPEMIFPKLLTLNEIIGRPVEDCKGLEVLTFREILDRPIKEIL